MTEAKIERVARAICWAMGTDPDSQVVEHAMVPQPSPIYDPKMMVVGSHAIWLDFREDARREIIAAAARRELLAIDMENREI